jgi:ribonuclease-3
MQSLNYKQIQSVLGIRFKRRTYLKLALTHSSYLQIQRRGFDRSNETLEFLGDAVLELVTRDYLLQKYPDANEGHLSELKKMYTNTQVLFKTGKRLKLGKFMLMNRGEESTGGRSRQSTIAACVEAIIGALYLDRGITYTAKFIRRTTNHCLIDGRCGSGSTYHIGS